VAGGGRAVARGRKGRLGRRSAGDIAALVDSIVVLHEKRPNGLRAEQIRSELGLEAKELPRPITEALAAKRIVKQGQKRATTYFARGGGAKGASKAGRKSGAAKNSKKGRKGAGKSGPDAAANGAAATES
jgi:hypothetical protein